MSFSIPSFTYSEYLMAGALFTAIAVIVTARGRIAAGRLIDCLIAGMIGALIVGRAGHVLLQWSYFSDHAHEIVQLERGGSDWHGALLGGWIGLAIMARLRGVALRPLLEACAPAIPLFLIAGWLACGDRPNTCGFGAEIATLADAPPGIAIEAPDVYGLAAPRWNTWAFGIALGVTIGVVLLLPRIRGRRWGVGLIGAGIGMLLVGGLRGDSVPLLAGVRVDQWLDLAVALAGMTILVSGIKRGLGVDPAPDPPAHPL